MIDINSVLDKLKEFFNIKNDKDLSIKLGFKESTVNSWRQRNTLNFQKVIEVAIKNNIDLNYLFNPNFNNINVKNELDELIEEFIFYYLKKEKKLDRNSILNLIFNPIEELLIRCLKKVDGKLNLTKKEAKSQLINIIQNCKINFLIDSPNKKELLIKEIEENYSNLECYVILKYKDKFI